MVLRALRGTNPSGDARLSQMRLPTPEHPLPGTAKDNAVDVARKGRNGAPKKLTPE
jgi:hypothetical protein